MHGLRAVTRRWFGKGMGAALTLAGLPGPLRAGDGTTVIEVEITRFAFAPRKIEIQSGGSVAWVNADVAPHTATAEDGVWDTGPLERGERGRITFDALGTYPYFCVFHPHMKGLVTVLPKTGA